MIMMMKVDDDHDDGDGDGDNDGEHLWIWLWSSDESYISQRSDVLWRFACGDVFILKSNKSVFVFAFFISFSFVQEERQQKGKG